MYELSRVRLFSVGPPGARYQDVQLDLRGVGPAVPATAHQVDLFAPDDLERVPRRPAQASVLFLENGGGKSVLLKLVFSVVLPGKRQVVGTTSTTLLEKFVLGEDVAHVALEWMHTRTGALLVTGKISEWRGHVASSDPDKLASAWYSFRPDAEFGLDDLPFTAERRRVTAAGFKDRLIEQQRRFPAIDLVWETGQGDWTRHLVDVGLDPELFRYQREMNAGEGEAAETFSFPTDEAFVDFLLRAVIDPDEPRNLADLVAGYAQRLAERADLERERDFVEGLLERLGPLIDAERRAAAAREAEVAAQGGAGALAAALAARLAQESERFATALAAHTDAREQIGSAESEERRLEAVTAELRRRVAVLELDAARQAEDAAQHAYDGAQLRLAAWQAVVPVLRHEVADAEACRLRGIVAAEQERARPALERRQDAACALAGGLRAMAAAADATAAAAADAATEADALADAARAAELARATAAATERAAAAQARAAVHGVDEAIACAVRAGHLGDGDGVAGAHTAAQAAERTAVADVASVHEELTAVRGTRLRVEGERAALRGAAAAARQTVERADAAVEEAAAARDALAAEPRLAELLGVAEIQPETDASALLDQLKAAIDAGDHTRIALLTAQQRDTRALKALGAGGLLPEPVEIEQVIEVLERAGIAAYSGWRYLTTMAAPQRASVLERLPHLVSGVLLNNPDDASRARAELERARLLPCTVVAVGVTAGMGAETAVAPGVDFVVPPNPAMFDETEAEAIRATLEIETDSRAAELESRTASLETDRTLSVRLRDWAQRHPPGELDALAAAAESAHAAVTAADRAVRDADADVAALDGRSAELERDEPRRIALADAARASATALATLLAQVERLPELLEKIRAADAAVERAEQEAERARAEAASARDAAEDARRTRDRQRRVAESCREERAALPLDGSEDGAGQGTQDESAPTLEVLRASYATAAAAYAAAEVDADLHGALRQAERDAAMTQSTLDELTEHARTAAGALLRTPDAADPVARRGATEQARSATARTAADLTAASAERTMAERALRGFTALTCPVDPYPAPTDLQDAREVTEQAAADLHAATARVAAARAAAAAAQAAEQEANSSSEGFRRVVESLDDAPSPATGAQPFRGDVDAAHTQWKTQRGAVRAAAGARVAAEREVRAATDAVAQFAQEARFSTVTSPVRKHVVGVGRTEMPALATEWQAALRPRLRTLTDDLANIVRHRSGIVTRLQGMVREALRTLRLAQRLSELPEGLSDWSGQQFLRIRFEEITDVVLHHELSEVVDRVAEERRSGRGPQQRDGMSLLLRGVRAAMPKGVRAEMLKPDAVLRTERLRVSEIRDVFSGGQQLTAAIVLYCTMASLRAHQRGEGRRPHAGVLFLDNPIGRASAGYLLELQFGVAQALGVQLIYTTGLFDAGALSAFPLIIRLRNDADLRAGRKYLSVADRAAQHVAELTAPDGTGQLAATRIFKRPDPARP